MYRLNSINRLTQMIVFAAVLVMLSIPAWAAKDYYLYDKQDTDDTVTYNAPMIEGGWFVAMDPIPDTAGPTLAGRMLFATGSNIYLQDAVDASSWTKVGEVTGVTMDPSFIKVSPDGSKVALGLGYYQDLLVFPLSSLDSSNPPDLITAATTTTFPSSVVMYYDAAWAGSSHLVINGGYWDEDTDTAYGVGISCLDVTAPATPPVTVVTPASYPGASSGIAVDSSMNLIFGNGYDYGYGTVPSQTGQLVLLPGTDWWASSAPRTDLGAGLDYGDAAEFAEAVLSAAHLGFDQEGNLHVGGGDFLGSGDVGYFALINADFMGTVANGTFSDVLDEDDVTQYREFMPDDVCGSGIPGNDKATAVISYGSSISGVWLDINSCGTTDSWGTGVTPKITTYRIDTAFDGDGDTYADVDDYSPWTSHSDNSDTDGDGYGNIIDGDFNNTGNVDYYDYLMFSSAFSAQNNSDCELNGTTPINFYDYVIFSALMGKEAPYYNTSF